MRRKDEVLFEDRSPQEMAELGQKTPVLKIQDLTVRVGNKLILEKAHLTIHRGEVVLLVGRSGAGKSILLQLICGVLDSSSPDLEVEGSIFVGDQDVLWTRGSCRTGLVFQDHALFDDLSARDNLLFAMAHGRRHKNDSSRARAEDLLRHFGLDNGVKVRVLSGGQKQRLAIARTIAHDPDFLVYDEPTTGLDPAGTKNVVNWIEKTQQEHGKTTLIVTHDYASLVHLAHRVILLDPASHSVREIEQSRINAELTAPAPVQVAEETAEKKRPSQLKGFFEGTANTLCASATYFAHLLPRYASFRWGLHFLGYYLKLLAFPSSLAYMAIAGLILGFVSTYFTFLHLPHRFYTEPLLSDEILAGLGYLDYRVLAPVLATLLIAARCGAAVASDIGNRAYSRQVDAMRSFGIEPSRYLLTAIALGFLIAVPLLVFTLYQVSRFTSMAVFVVTHPEHSPFFWDQNFHRLLTVPGRFWPVGSGWMILKTEICGAGVGAIAYFRGIRPKRSGDQISLAVTSTIIWATLFVLATHFVFAFFEYGTAYDS
jgi:ABC-type multidrug transport system ATPase subunit/ABC-type transporter Mla maintaining outer membrane lipid asymmetry permease subunit MlaE